MTEPAPSDPADRRLRKFILEHYAAGAYEIDGRVLVQNMDTIFQWAKNGEVPVGGKHKSLAVVPKAT